MFELRRIAKAGVFVGACMLMSACRQLPVFETAASARVSTVDLGTTRYGYIADIETDAAGNVYLIGPDLQPGGYTLLRIAPDGSLVKIPGHYSNPLMAVGDDGAIYIANSDGGFGEDFRAMVYRLRDDGEQELISDQLDRVMALAVDANGRLLIYRSNGPGNHNQILRWDPAAQALELLAGSERPIDGALAANLDVRDGKGTAAILGFPNSFSVDGAGNAYTADVRGNLRRIAGDGTVETLPHRPINVMDLAMDEDGDFYLFEGSAVAKLCANGQQYMLAGTREEAVQSRDGNGEDARFLRIIGGGRDARGNLYVAEWDISREPWQASLRKIAFEPGEVEMSMQPANAAVNVPIGVSKSVRDTPPLGVRGIPAGTRGPLQPQMAQPLKPC